MSSEDMTVSSLDESRDHSRDRDIPESRSLTSGQKTTYGVVTAELQRPVGSINADNDSHVDEGKDGVQDEAVCTSCHCCTHCSCSFCTTPVVSCALFHFSFVGAYGCILPYISVYMKQIGLSPQQIGLISGLRPVVAFCSAPLWGALADRYHIRKVLLMISLVSWLAFFVALFHIPPPDRLDTCPTDIVVVQRSFGDFLVAKRALSGATNTSQLMRYSTDPLSNKTTEEEFTPDQIETMTMYRGWIYTPDSVWRVFVTCLSLIVSGEVFQSPTSALSDTGTLHTLDESGLSLDNYGNVRAWGALGYGISSFLAGALVSSSRKKEVLCGVELYFSDYRLLTYVFIGFIVVSFIAATQIKFKEGDDEENVELTGDKEKKSKSQDTSDVSKKKHDAGAVVRIFFNLHYGSWLATSFFVGICNGVIWGFLYWHLDNLGASQLLMGVSGIVVCFSEFVMFFLVGKVIKLLGHIGVMYLGLLGYTVRFCIYAVIRNPWWVLPAEILQGITFSIVWVSMTAYTTMAVPTASLATIQGIIHGVYFGLGSGSGHLIGGIMIGYVGAVITFFSFAGATVFVLLLFVVAQKCSTKPPDVYGYKDLDEETDKPNVSSECSQETSLQTDKTRLDD